MHTHTQKKIHAHTDDPGCKTASTLSEILTAMLTRPCHLRPRPRHFQERYITNHIKSSMGNTSARNVNMNIYIHRAWISPHKLFKQYCTNGWHCQFS